jgi:L-ascorbate metabolism protein UlaG (beta-lactamase superfamily)
MADGSGGKLKMHLFGELGIPSGSVGIHWFEQNSYALKDSLGYTILIDPYFPAERPADRFIHSLPPLVESELPTHCVLLTHAHGDHTSSETVARIHTSWPDVVYVGPEESIRQILQETDVTVGNTRVIHAGESALLGCIIVQAFHSKPSAGDPAAGIEPPDVTHLGYVIEMEGIRLYNTGDAINTLADHDELLEPIAAANPDIGCLTTHPTEGEFPFFEDSVRLAQKLGLRTVVPSHYACFVKRNYDPQVWASRFPADGPTPLIIPWNSYVVYS